VSVFLLVFVLVFVLVVLFVVVVAVMAQEPCDIPPQFMTRFEAVEQDSSACKFSDAEGEIYYDYPNQQMRIDQSLSFYDLDITESLYLDYNNQLIYIFDRDTETCTYDDLTGELQQPEIPFDATFEGTFMIGSQPVDTWVTQDDDGTIDVLTVTDATCFAVTETIVNVTTNIATLSETFWNFLPTLPPFYFDLPDECKSNAKRSAPENARKVRIPISFGKK